MKDQHMRWDQALLRKFSNTGHFRLLNQIKTELNAQPLVRDQITKNLTVETRPIRVGMARTIPKTNEMKIDVEERSIDVVDDNNPKSFRERLNAIEMR